MRSAEPFAREMAEEAHPFAPSRATGAQQGGGTATGCNTNRTAMWDRKNVNTGVMCRDLAEMMRFLVIKLKTWGFPLQLPQNLGFTDIYSIKKDISRDKYHGFKQNGDINLNYYKRFDYLVI